MKGYVTSFYGNLLFKVFFLELNLEKNKGSSPAQNPFLAGKKPRNVKPGDLFDLFHPHETNNKEDSDFKLTQHLLGIIK